ncbi:MAG: DMT family transporter [Cyanobacteriota bacterium]
MSVFNIVKLILLSIIWSLGYVFMKNVVPHLGAIWTADLRFLLGGVILFIYLKFTKKNFYFKENWKKYLILGVLNLAIPISIVSLSLLYIPVSYATIINSLTPLFGVLSSAVFLKERINFNQILGMFFGFSGVFFIVNKPPPSSDYQTFIIGIVCCLIGSLCFALAGVYIKSNTKGVDPYSMAACSQLFAALVMFPIGLFKLPTRFFEFDIITNLLALGILGSALGYIIYYNLMIEIGPAKTLTIMFLIPFFGMIWSILFFNEAIHAPMVLGCVLVLLGTFFVNKSPNKKLA